MHLTKFTTYVTNDWIQMVNDFIKNKSFERSYKRFLKKVIIITNHHTKGVFGFVERKWKK
jgi:hypothetical protein